MIELKDFLQTLFVAQQVASVENLKKNLIWYWRLLEQLKTPLTLAATVK